MDLNTTKVICGWKGCDNVFSTVEVMNVHVQADHMLYRVYLQTEYQGKTHLNVYDQQKNDAPKPQISAYPPEDIQSSVSINPTIIPLASNVSESPVAPIPVTVAVRPDVVVDQDSVPTATASTSETPSIKSTTDNNNQRVSYSPTPPPPKKKARKPTSKYWTYTDHLTYRCNVISCTSEFNNPDTARHHYYTIHKSGSASTTPEQPTTSAKSLNKSKRVCPRTGCLRFFFSQDAVEKHLQEMHSEDDVNNNIRADELKPDDDSDDPDYEPERKEDEMKEIPGKDKDHIYY